MMYVQRCRMYGSNSVDAFTPTLWASEGLLQLQNNMVAAPMVYTDFSPIVANFGDTVNAQRPNDFTAVRKGANDDITLQDATASSVSVVLNHLVHNSFIIRDAERSKSFKDLIDVFIVPSARAMAQYVDQVILAQVYQFMPNVSGDLATVPTRGSIVDVRTKMNSLQIPQSGRSFLLSAASEGDMLKIDDFTNAQVIGDDGTALRQASLGRKYGFDILMDQNVSSVGTGNTIVTGAINNAAGYPAGTTNLAAVDGLSAAITAGTFLTVGGDDRPRRVVSTTGGATPTAIVIDTALDKAVVDNAVITLYTPGVVATTRAAGYYGKIDFTGAAPLVGQMIAFGASTTTERYACISVGGGFITLDRPLDLAITVNDKINYGPKGNYNVGLYRNAIALVNRPLSLPEAGTGVRSAVVNAGGFSMRWTMGYDMVKQGHICTFDMLMGVKVLDSRLCVPFLGK